MNPRLYSFIGGASGDWVVSTCRAVVGDSIGYAPRLSIVSGVPLEGVEGASWILSGVTSNERYATRSEKNQLVAKQVSIGRSEATCAALIPIRKNAAWWSMTQDERREIFEERSHHTSVGLKYLPSVARRLHHCRDLDESAPFDFLTLFDYTPADANAFEDLVSALRETEEWKYVDRELDIRMIRA
jgi:chlorite dismutase